MVFEYILKKNGIDPKNDLTIDQSINFGLTAAAFTSNDADYTIEFEPFATTLETEGNGTVVASLGVDSGYVPYTAYCAKQSYLNRHPEIIQSFTNAIQKGLAYVNSHSADEIAETIQPQFPETDRAAIARIVERYKAQDTWKNDTIFHRDSFELLENILEEAGELKERIPYEKLLDEMTAGKIGHGKFLLKLTPDEPTSPEAASGDSALRPDGTRASTGRTLSPFVIILLSTGAMRERTNPHPNHLPLNSRSGLYVTTTVLDRTWKDDAAGVLPPQRPFPHANRRYTLK